MVSASSDPVDVRELRGVKFSMDVKNPQGMTSDSKQGSLGAYSSGANALAAAGEMQKLVELVIEIRATLVANGMMKGSA